MRAPLIAIGLALAAMTAPALADDAAAKALFDQGKALFAEGHYTDACSKLEASFKLNPLSGTRGLLAACYEKVDKLASAWAAYRDSAQIADKQGNAERAKAARDSAAALEPKLAHLTIDATAAVKVPHLKVTIDGQEQPPGALDAEIPVDSGQHLVEATAVDHVPWKTTVDIQNGEKQRAAVPALAPDLTRRHAIEQRANDEHQIAHRRKLIALGLFAGGGVSVAVASTLAVMAHLEWNRAKDAGCASDGVCPSDAGKHEVDRAAAKADVATYVGGAGLALLGAGVFIYLTSPRPHTEVELQLVPTVGPSSAGLVLGGRF